MQNQSLRQLESSGNFASPRTALFFEEADFFANLIRNLNRQFLESVSEFAKPSLAGKRKRHFSIDDQTMALFLELDFEEYEKLAISSIVVAKLSNFNLEELPGYAKRYSFTPNIPFRNDAIFAFFRNYLGALKKAVDRDSHKAAFLFRISNAEADFVKRADDEDIRLLSVIHTPEFSCVFSAEDFRRVFNEDQTYNAWNHAMLVNRVMAEAIPEKILFNNSVTTRALGTLLSTNVLSHAKSRIEEFIDQDRFGMLVDLGVKVSWASHVLQNGMAQSAWQRDMRQMGLIKPENNDRLLIHKLDAMQHLNFTAFSLLFLAMSDFEQNDMSFADNFAFSYLFFKHGYQKDFDSIYEERAKEIKDIFASTKQAYDAEAFQNMLSASPSSLFRLAYSLIGGHLKTRRSSTDFMYADLSRNGVDFYGTYSIRENREGAFGVAQCPHCGAYYLAAYDLYSGKTCPFCASKEIASPSSRGNTAAPFRYFDVTDTFSSMYTDVSETKNEQKTESQDTASV